MTRNILIEVAAFTPDSAINAGLAGADRIELCSGYAEGGLSPSPGTIKYVRDKLDIPIHAMIRPRVGDFIYKGADFNALLEDIKFCRGAGVDGIVVGVLTKHRTVDVEGLQRIIEVAKPMSITFHRAFDLCLDLYQALDTLMASGVDRVLTSGGKPNVTEGTKNIWELVKWGGDRIKILAGGGVSAENVLELIENTGINEVHLSGKKLITSDIIDKDLGVKLTDEGQVTDLNWYECAPEKIKKVKQKIVGG